MNLFETRTTQEAPVIQTPEGVDPIQELPGYGDLTDFPPSDEQRRIFGFIDQGRGDGIVESVAGSGKTETLLGCARLIEDSESCLICAFNKPVEEELSDKIDQDNVEVRTLHSKGKQILKKSREQSFEYRDGKMWGIVGQKIQDVDGDREQMMDDATDICARVKQTCTDPRDAEAVKEVATFFGYDWREEYKRVVEEAINASMKEARKSGVIDYDDMVYIPVQFDEVRGEYDWVLVDEAQDLNSAQQLLALGVCKEEGRCLFVGDENQAINGFQGADPNAISHIEERIRARRGNEATRMSLSTCYRCPTSHISKAQELVPRIKPWARAREGTLEKRKLEHLPEYLVSSDHRDSEEDVLVLCRTNGPLIDWCVTTALEKETTAWVQGQDMHKKLKDLIEEAVEQAEADEGFRALQNGLKRCEENAKAIANKKENASTENIQLRIEILRKVIDRVGERPVATIKRRVKDYFEPSEHGIKFSTIHRAKGQEADCVYVIEPDTSYQKGPEWQKQQEENIRYVMYTRSKGTLVLMYEDEEKVGEIDRGVQDGYSKMGKEEIETGDWLGHVEYGRGEVVATDGARDGVIVMDFGADGEGFREVSLEKQVLRWV